MVPVDFSPIDGFLDKIDRIFGVADERLEQVRTDARLRARDCIDAGYVVYLGVRR